MPRRLPGHRDVRGNIKHINKDQIMTHENVSILRDDIRELKTRIDAIHLENIEINGKLWSLELKVDCLWFKIWAPALGLAPWAFILLAILTKHS